MTKKTLFVLNPIAGTSKRPLDVIPAINRYFQADQFALHKTTCRGDATLVAKQAVQAGFSKVVAIGGDGTVNEVASGLVGTNTSFGIIPRGSGNGLARSLRIPLSTHAALKVVHADKTRMIDIGNVGDRYFCNAVGVGFDAVVSQKFDSFGFRGRLAYALVIGRELMRYRPIDACLEMNGERFKQTAFLIAAANAREYGNGAVIAPGAVLDDGYLDLCVMGAMSPFHVLAAIARFFTGSLDKHKNVRYYRLNQLALSFDSPLHYHVDGEPLGLTKRLEISIVPEALKICVPQ